MLQVRSGLATLARLSASGYNPSRLGSGFGLECPWHSLCISFISFISHLRDSAQGTFLCFLKCMDMAMALDISMGAAIPINIPINT